MSPLLHKSTTWAIVGAVVLAAAWLASNVQDKHDRGSFRLRMAQQSAAPASGSDVMTPVHLTPQAQAKVQLASAKR
ncbi:hypothetical protein CDN99_20215 [Roseateles aquatilis]|uniref:Uncharacterized protein n=1 Tax=Roseateles aquatilis TaxID=431061 RepID=A0A246J0R8_9BURK|nr:hypothetical protein [Roseateles aquatilis]OWQ86166.1 hypothetical protein CDN99_20215 [Roseateles aquatilis]